MFIELIQIYTNKHLKNAFYTLKHFQLIGKTFFKRNIQVFVYETFGIFIIHKVNISAPKILNLIIVHFETWKNCLYKKFVEFVGKKFSKNKSVNLNLIYIVLYKSITKTSIIAIGTKFNKISGNAKVSYITTATKIDSK